MSARRAKKKKVLNTLIVILLLVIVLCGAAIFLLVHHWRQEPAEPTVPTEATAESIPETTPPATAATEPTTEPTAPETEAPEPQQPENLTKLLEHNGTSCDALLQAGCSQLVVVVSQGTAADIRFFSCTDGLWEELHDLACDGYVGRSGVLAAKQEGDGSTPSGLYRIGSAFYIDDAPDTALDTFRVTKDTYWVDDADSMFYNQRVEGTENKDWNSAEHMIDYEAEYRYGFVVNYNVLGIPDAGSAIFFHINDAPTAGCIATEEDMVLAYLAELDKEKCPSILIVSGEALASE